MKELTRLSIEAAVLLRQRIDQRLDSEIDRLVNGLYPNPDIEHELDEIINGSSYTEIVRGLNA